MDSQVILVNQDFQAIQPIVEEVATVVTRVTLVTLDIVAIQD